MNSTEAERAPQQRFGDWREHGPKQAMVRNPGRHGSHSLGVLFRGQLLPGRPDPERVGLPGAFPDGRSLCCALPCGSQRLAAGYRIIPRYIGLAEALRLFAAAVAAGVVLVVPILLRSLWAPDCPWVPSPLGALGAFAVMGGWRQSNASLLSGDSVRSNGRRTGYCWWVLVEEPTCWCAKIRRMRGLDVEVVGLVDDNPRPTGLHVHGSPVLGTSRTISLPWWPPMTCHRSSLPSPPPHPSNWPTSTSCREPGYRSRWRRVSPT